MRDAVELTVVGSVNLDLVARVERLPRPGETLAARSLDRVPGGKGANQALAAARLGASVRLRQRAPLLRNVAPGRPARHQHVGQLTFDRLIEEPAHDRLRSVFVPQLVVVPRHPGREAG